MGQRGPGNWSIISKADLDRSIAAGAAETVEQAQADATAAAMDQVSVMISEYCSRPRKRKLIEWKTSENLRETLLGLRSAISDLLPTTPAAVRRPKRESSPLVPSRSSSNQAAPAATE